MDEKKYELVVSILNAGFSQIVMEAARNAGAKGGTVVRARGTANPEAEEFFNITIQPDKEMLLLLVPAEVKDKILQALYKVGGPGTNAAGIAFSVPVSRTTTIKE